MAGSAWQTPAPDTAPTLKSPAPHAQQRCWHNNDTAVADATQFTMQLSMCKAGLDKAAVTPPVLRRLLSS